MHFYVVIIGTEILNGRREDKHFTFVKSELQNYGHEIFASFVIKDDAILIETTYQMILQDPQAILFSFGGIGSTPDDLTREIAAKVFTNLPLKRHEQFEQDIIERFADAAYPHRIHMADLPQNASLLFNPVNNMSGFSLEQKYFFVPGFPEMAHPMISWAIQTYFSVSNKQTRKTLLAQTSENTLIDIMKLIPKELEFSSLPMFRDGKPMVEISISGVDAKSVAINFALFEEYLTKEKINYNLI